jgi:hypothetical protein
MVRRGGARPIRVGDQLAVNAEPPSGQVLLDPLEGEASCEQARSNTRTSLGPGSSSVTSSSCARRPTGRGGSEQLVQ